MKIAPTGFDYDSSGKEYSARRRTDPVLARFFHEALGSARSVLNVGAGSGSYEPEGRIVVAVEPSATMRSQRSPDRVPAIAASAENLPFDDKVFDASMALFTIHHWRDLTAGLDEMRRVTRGPVLIFTSDPALATVLWLSRYCPQLADVDRRRYPTIETINDKLGGQSEALSVPIPCDCVDGFREAFFARPEAFLDSDVRAAQSVWSHLPEYVEERAIAKLASDLNSGKWDEKYGDLRRHSTFTGALKLIRNLPDGGRKSTWSACC